jgi:hypothetical protein
MRRTTSGSEMAAMTSNRPSQRGHLLGVAEPEHDTAHALQQALAELHVGDDLDAALPLHLGQIDAGLLGPQLGLFQALAPGEL